MGRTRRGGSAIQIANLRIDVCVHTRFGRTHDTAAIALAGRDVPFEVEPLLDDIDVGELEGATLDEYREWKEEHTRHDPFPGGESLDDAAGRYADAFRRLADRPEEVALVVCHEIPIRYALNGAADSTDLDGPVHAIPNAAPFVFEGPSLARAAAAIESLRSRY